MPFNFRSIETSFGSLVEENEDLEKLMNWEQEKIKNKIGIERRYLSNNEENTDSCRSSLSKLQAVNI